MAVLSSPQLQLLPLPNPHNQISREIDPGAKLLGFVFQNILLTQ